MISDKKHKHIAGRIINYSISLLLTAIFLYIAFYDVEFDQVLEILSGASITWIVLLIIVWYFSHYLRALRWKVILHSVKGNSSVKHLFGALMVGYGVNCVVPRLGEISRSVVLGRWENLSRSSMFGTVIVERVIDIIFLGIALVISVFISGDILFQSFPWLRTTLYLTLLFILVAIVIIYLTVRLKEKFYGIIVSMVGKISEKFGQTTAHIFGMLTEGFASLKGVKNYSLTLLLSVAIMILYALTSYMGFFTIEMDNIRPVSFEMGWVLMSVSAIGVVIPTPGGTGSYHTLAKSVLVLLYAFPEETSLAYAILMHIISYILFIFTALIVFFLLDKQRGNLLKVVETELEEL
ncbi:MAG: lysylphosphatidylglycerol synthase transmembrane domain-containing protein [Ignavibacteriaceae bacterium]